jgi:hypothetical protein
MCLRNEILLIHIYVHVDRETVHSVNKTENSIPITVYAFNFKL